MSGPLYLQDWFPEPLSGEAAYAVHAFLEHLPCSSKQPTMGKSDDTWKQKTNALNNRQ